MKNYMKLFQLIKFHRFDKTNGFVRVSGSEFKHLVLFDNGLFDKSYK